MLTVVTIPEICWSSLSKQTGHEGSSVCPAGMGIKISNKARHYRNMRQDFASFCSSLSDTLSSSSSL